MENFSRLTQEIFKMNSILHFLLLICLLFHNGWSQNSVITCPSPIYREGNNELTLVIKTADFTTCDVPPTSVTCEWFPNRGTVRTICTQSVTSCDGNLTSRGCRCAEQNGQNYEYKLAFSKSSDDVTGNISCTVDCVVYDPNDPKATVRTDSTCQNIAFVSKCAETETKCEHGVCRINQMDEPFCDCTGTIYNGQYCHVRVRSIIKMIALPVGLVGLAVLALTALICILKKLCATWTDPNVTLTAEDANALRKILKEEACCSCSPVEVSFLDEPTDNRTVILLKSRNFWNLWKAKRQTQAFIKKTTTSDSNNEPPADYPTRSLPQPKYTGQGNGQRKNKADKEIQLSRMRGSSPPSETPGDENRQMIPPTQGRALPVPRKQHETNTTGIGSSASRRLEPVQNDSSRMPSVERNSGAFSRELPSPSQQPLGPIPSGKTS